MSKRNEHSVVDGVEGKMCSTCRTWTPIHSFTKRASNWDGLGHQCKPCSRAAIRRSHVKRTYGITHERYDEMLEAQGGVCAVCGDTCKTHARLSIDHDHITGEVRGLLCRRCNSALGMLDDDPERIERLAEHARVSKRVRN